MMNAECDSTDFDELSSSLSLRAEGSRIELVEVRMKRELEIVDLLCE